MEVFWDVFSKEMEEKKSDCLMGTVFKEGKGSYAGTLSARTLESLLQRYHWWLEEKGLVFDPNRGFTIQQLICLEAKSDRMAEVTRNSSWKRTYHRLSDAAAELMGRIHRTRV